MTTDNIAAAFVCGIEVAFRFLPRVKDPHHGGNKRTTSPPTFSPCGHNNLFYGNKIKNLTATLHLMCCFCWAGWLISSFDFVSDRGMSIVKCIFYINARLSLLYICIKVLDISFMHLTR